MKKFLAGVALAGILTFSAGTVAAQASPGHPAAPPATADFASPLNPGSVTFSGSGFTPGETIDITVTVSDPVAGEVTGSRPASTAMADGSGAFSALVVLEPVVLIEQVGSNYSLLATGATSGVTANQLVTLVSSGPVAGEDGLAYTGIDAAGAVVLSIIAVGAVGGGVGMVAVSRRRTSGGQAAWQH